jgi:hypothetical protein
MPPQSPFELLGQGRVRIGSVDLKVHEYPAATADEDRYVIEATADQHQKFAQHFPPHELRSTRPSDLPNGLYLSIERLEHGRAIFRNLHFLTVKKYRDQTTLTLAIYFEHWDWHLPESVTTFAERYASALTALPGGGSLALAQTQDTGAAVTYSLVAPVDQDIYTSFQNAAQGCLKQFRTCIAEGYKTSSGSSARSKSPFKIESSDSTGPRWWVRFVLVPLLGSGAFAAFIAALIAIAK